MDLGAKSLPQIPRHSGDRNRTSPFAFTGNKFEFRAVGSTASIAWPNTVLNTIVAESLDWMATELEKAAGRSPSPAKLQTAVLGVLQKVIGAHKRVLFDGDGYSAEWRAEAESRGLPVLSESLAAFPVLTSKKVADLFKKYGVLSRNELESRHHIVVEKYVKQLVIEAETMITLGRTAILPAAIQHQARLATAVSATEAAGVECPGTKAALQDVVLMVRGFREALVALEEVSARTAPSLMAHAIMIRDQIRPAMTRLREAADLLENHVSADLWPLPTYRELLVMK